MRKSVKPSFRVKHPYSYLINSIILGIIIMFLSISSALILNLYRPNKPGVDDVKAYTGVVVTVADVSAENPDLDLSVPVIVNGTTFASSSQVINGSEITFDFAASGFGVDESHILVMDLSFDSPVSPRIKQLGLTTSAYANDQLNLRAYNGGDYVYFSQSQNPEEYGISYSDDGTYWQISSSTPISGIEVQYSISGDQSAEPITIEFGETYSFSFSGNITDNRLYSMPTTFGPAGGTFNGASTGLSGATIDGSGTKDSPYKISNWNDLMFLEQTIQKIAEQNSTSYPYTYYKLTADFTYSYNTFKFYKYADSSWSEDSTVSSFPNFYGCLLGYGHTLTVTHTKSGASPMIPNIYGATIANLNIVYSPSSSYSMSNALLTLGASTYNSRPNVLDSVNITISNELKFLASRDTNSSYNINNASTSFGHGVLIGHVNTSAQVKMSNCGVNGNVNLEISSGKTGGFAFGVMVGANWGTVDIQNCSYTGTITEKRYSSTNSFNSTGFSTTISGMVGATKASTGIKVTIDNCNVNATFSFQSTSTSYNHGSTYKRLQFAPFLCSGTTSALTSIHASITNSMYNKNPSESYSVKSYSNFSIGGTSYVTYYGISAGGSGTDSCYSTYANATGSCTSYYTYYTSYRGTTYTSTPNQTLPSSNFAFKNGWYFGTDNKLYLQNRFATNLSSNSGNYDSSLGFTNGTSSNIKDYYIHDAKDLNCISGKMISYVNINLCADIDMTGYNWEPCFLASQATFNGNGYSIKNVTIINKKTALILNNYGFFDSIAETSSVNGVTFENVYMWVSKNEISYSISAIAGHVNGNLSYVYVQSLGIHVANVIETTGTIAANIGGYIAGNGNSTVNPQIKGAVLKDFAIKIHNVCGGNTNNFVLCGFGGSVDGGNSYGQCSSIMVSDYDTTLGGTLDYDIGIASSRLTDAIIKDVPATNKTATNSTYRIINTAGLPTDISTDGYANTLSGILSTILSGNYGAKWGVYTSQTPQEITNQMVNKLTFTLGSSSGGSCTHTNMISNGTVSQTCQLCGTGGTVTEHVCQTCGYKTYDNFNFDCGLMETTASTSTTKYYTCKNYRGAYIGVEQFTINGINITRYDTQDDSGNTTDTVYIDEDHTYTNTSLAQPYYFDKYTLNYATTNRYYFPGHAEGCSYYYNVDLPAYSSTNGVTGQDCPYCNSQGTFSHSEIYCPECGMSGGIINIIASVATCTNCGDHSDQPVQEQSSTISGATKSGTFAFPSASVTGNDNLFDGGYTVNSLNSNSSSVVATQANSSLTGNNQLRSVVGSNPSLTFITLVLYECEPNAVFYNVYEDNTSPDTSVNLKDNGVFAKSAYRVPSRIISSTTTSSGITTTSYVGTDYLPRTVNGTDYYYEGYLSDKFGCFAGETIYFVNNPRNGYETLHDVWYMGLSYADDTIGWGNSDDTDQNNLYLASPTRYSTATSSDPNVSGYKIYKYTVPETYTNMNDETYNLKGGFRNISDSYSDVSGIIPGILCHTTVSARDLYFWVTVDANAYKITGNNVPTVSVSGNGTVKVRNNDTNSWISTGTPTGITPNNIGYGTTNGLYYSWLFCVEGANASTQVTVSYNDIISGSYYYAVNTSNTSLNYLKSYSQTHLLSKNVSKGATDYAASFTNITSLVQKTGTTKSIEFTGASTGYFVTSAPNTDGYGTVPQIVMACADIHASDRIVTRLTSVSTDYYSNGTGTTASVTPKFKYYYNGSNYSDEVTDLFVFLGDKGTSNSWLNLNNTNNNKTGNTVQFDLRYNSATGTSVASSSSVSTNLDVHPYTTASSTTTSNNTNRRYLTATYTRISNTSTNVKWVNSYVPDSEASGSKVTFNGVTRNYSTTNQSLTTYYAGNSDFVITFPTTDPKTYYAQVVIDGTGGSTYYVVNSDGIVLQASNTTGSTPTTANFKMLWSSIASSVFSTTKNIKQITITLHRFNWSQIALARETSISAVNSSNPISNALEWGKFVNTYASSVTSTFTVDTDINFCPSSLTIGGTAYAYSHNYDFVGLTKTFTGTFDGGFHSFTNIRAVNSTDVSSFTRSLFASNSGTIQQVVLLAVNSPGTNSAAGVSILCNSNTGTIQNCYWYSSADVGGYSQLVGSNDGTMKQVAIDIYTSVNFNGFVLSSNISLTDSYCIVKRASSSVQVYGVCGTASSTAKFERLYFAISDTITSGTVTPFWHSNNGATFTNCYYYRPSGIYSSTFGTSLASGVLGQQSSYEGFTFGENAWLIDNNSIGSWNNTYHQYNRGWPLIATGADFRTVTNFEFYLDGTKVAATTASDTGKVYVDSSTSGEISLKFEETAGSSTNASIIGSFSTNISSLVTG
ncbi:MAG: hypothetical protein SPK63_01495, partial [Eubacteriales bacterium]|nr:hypothetical protein [Eubacteriales bacterium]